MRIAKRGTRFSNAFLDSIISSSILWALSSILNSAGVTLIDNGVFNIPTLIMAFIYYFSFELAFSRTPAKFITTTKVVTVNGGKPTPKQILIRTLCRFIPFEFVSFLAGRGWHDSMSETEVIDI